MELKERMDLLLNAGVLSQKNYENVEKVIDYFKQQHGITLTEENASAFITHLCMALERLDKGEEVKPLDRAVFEEVKQEDSYAQAAACCSDMNRMLPQLPEAEAEYICTHVGVMLAGLSKG